VVSVHQISAYTSSLNWTEPNSFLPERWLPAENTRFAHDNHATLQPFSVGPRSCLGRNLAYNELRLILARLLWNFDLELCTESENWIKKKSFTAWEKKPMFVKLRQRKMSEQ
jgi:cytochrome P450